MHYTFVSALIFFFFISTNNVSASLVRATCKHLSKTDRQNINYDFCVSKLESDSRSSSSTAKQLGEISFQLTISKAEEVLSTMDRVLKQPSIDLHVEDSLKVCWDFYVTIPVDLREGLAALKGYDYRKADTTVSSVVKKASTCGTVIKDDSRGVVSVVKEQTGEFGKLSAISLGFTKLLRVVN
ncbi:hypothetical protein RND81_01G205200 [Saponaria officinalis]|uniref:Pectinesterase inhibitor domain-containing protein n=1 Tax=Saponaria officinalis TaxID=3572 RepID=A0AAW1N8W5_SAPOF